MNDEAQNEVDALIRFLNQMHGTDMQTDAKLAGMQAARLRITDLLNKKPGRKKGRPITVDHPAFGVAMAYVRGEIPYVAATAQIASLIYKGERTAEQQLAEMLPRARSTVEALNMLDNLPQKIDR